MHTRLLQLLVLCLFVLYVYASTESRPNVLKLTYKPRTAKQLRSFHAKHSKLPEKTWAGQAKYWMPNYPYDILMFFYEIGTPPVEFWVNIETGRKHIWVIDVSYPNTTDKMVKYNANDSSTSVRTGRYADGYTGTTFLEGITYVDRVSFLQIYNWTQEFATITDTWDENGQREEFSIAGVMGNAWDPNEDIDNVTNKSSPILNLLKAYNAKQKIFSFWMERSPDGDFAEGSMTIGIINNSTCDSDHTWIPLVYFDLYAPLAFVVEGFKIGGYKTRRGGLGKVDTGLPVIFLPYAPYQAVYKALQPDYDFNLHIFTVPCSKKGQSPDWVFTIEGRDFVVRSQYYIMDIELSNGQCALAVEAAVPGEIDWAFGNPFLREYCQHFDIDNQRLGLSTALFEPDE